MKRMVYFLAAAVAIVIAGFGALSQASANTAPAALDDSSYTQAWGGAGAEFLPCEDGILTWEFNLAGPTMASSATLSVNGVTQPGVQTGDFTWSFTSPGAGVTASSDVFVTYMAPQQLFEAAVGIVSCDTNETHPTTVPTTAPTTTQTTETTPVLPSESTRTTTTNVLPTESTRPVPTAVEAGISGPPASGGSSSHVLSALGILGGLAIAASGAFALMRRRGQHEA